MANSSNITSAIEQYIALQGDRFLTSLHRDVMRLTEKELLSIILKRTQGNRSQAAKMLGISRVTLLKKIETYQLGL